VARQYELGLQDLADGRLVTAAERFRFVLSLNPQHAEAAQRLAEVEAWLAQTEAAPTQPGALLSTPALTPRAQAPPAELLQQAQAALAAEDWDGALALLNQLRATQPAFEADQVRQASHQAYRARGLARIRDQRLQEGIFDLNLAETYGALDEEAEAFRVWATLYVRGNALWGADWPAVIAIYQDLYRAAPYFHDTAARLFSAQVAYGDQLLGLGDPCGAAAQYGGALQVQADAAVDEMRRAAEAACAAITPTPAVPPTDTPGAEATPSPPTETPPP
jgi:hypothetical protein